jgi:hypothetical protein
VGAIPDPCRKEYALRISRLFVAATAALALSGLGVTAAAAAPHANVSPSVLAAVRNAVSTPKHGYSHLLRPSHGVDGYANQTSTNWSGYAASSGTYTSVSSSWVEPTVSCNTQGIVAFWIGLDGWGSSTVEQDGTGVDCSSGSPQYFAWWETYPANSIQEYGDTVQPGDSLTSTVTDEGNDTYDMVLTDNTEGWSEDNPEQGASGASDASAEIIAEAVTSGSSVTALPDFGSIGFSGSTINGSTMESSNAQAIDMTDSSGNVIARTGATDGSGDFTITYAGGGGFDRGRRG